MLRILFGVIINSLQWHLTLIYQKQLIAKFVYYSPQTYFDHIYTEVHSSTLKEDVTSFTICIYTQK